jgi:hypothetical protein
MMRRGVAVMVVVSGRRRAVVAAAVAVDPAVVAAVGMHTCPRGAAVADTRAVDISAVVAATAAAIGKSRCKGAAHASPLPVLGKVCTRQRLAL